MSRPPASDPRRGRKRPLSQLAACFQRASKRRTGGLNSTTASVGVMPALVPPMIATSRPALQRFRSKPAAAAWPAARRPGTGRPPRGEVVSTRCRPRNRPCRIRGVGQRQGGGRLAVGDVRRLQCLGAPAGRAAGGPGQFYHAAPRREARAPVIGRHGLSCQDRPCGWARAARERRCRGAVATKRTRSASSNSRTSRRVGGTCRSVARGEAGVEAHQGVQRIGRAAGRV